MISLPLRLNDILHHLLPFGARESSPSCEAMIFMSGLLPIASVNPLLRSFATLEPVVPFSSTIPALPFVCFASHSPARCPSLTKSDLITVTKSTPGVPVASRSIKINGNLRGFCRLKSRGKTFGFARREENRRNFAGDQIFHVRNLFGRRALRVGVGELDICRLVLRLRLSCCCFRRCATDRCFPSARKRRFFCRRSFAAAWRSSRRLVCVAADKCDGLKARQNKNRFDFSKKTFHNFYRLRMYADL